MRFFRDKRAPAERIEPRIDPVAMSPENPSTPLSNPDAWLIDWNGGNMGYTGPPVNERSAMTVSAVYSCVTLLSGLLGSIPLKIYLDSDTKGQVEAPDHRLSPLFDRTPFPGRALTSHAWRESWGINVYLWGNHYSVIRYDNANRVIGFEPAPPWAVNVNRLANGRNQYVIDWGGIPVQREIVDQDDILHFAGPGFDGIKGASRIGHFAKTAIGVARTLQEQTGYVHENAAKPSGMVTNPPGISADGMRRQRAAFNDQYAGRQNAGRVIQMDAGATYTPFQMSPEDLNTIEALKYSAEDICRFFRVPPVMAGVTGDATNWGSGIEQLMLGFLRFTMDGEFKRIESELNLKLLPKSQHYAQFDRNELLAMDALAAAQVAATEINAALLTPNEGRKAKRRPSLGKLGDNPLVNSTMITLERAVNPPEPAAPAGGDNQLPETTPKPAEPQPKSPKPAKPAPKKEKAP